MITSCSQMWLYHLISYKKSIVSVIYIYIYSLIYRLTSSHNSFLKQYYKLNLYNNKASGLIQKNSFIRRKMSLLSLPDESLGDIFSFLDKKSLYKCLFINRYLCIYPISIFWKSPFNNNHYKPKASSVIKTLLACLNEHEISSLSPYKIKFNNWTPLFEYGKFVRKIDHATCVENIVDWLESSGNDCTIQELVNAIYHAIMR